MSTTSLRWWRPNTPMSKRDSSSVGHRTTLATPLLSQGEALGAISVRKNHVHPFSDRQIALLQTFADQAVIAIENTRLFEAEQASKRELQESLEYQTATSDVLGVIAARRPTFSRCSDSGRERLRLCGAYDGIILLREGDCVAGQGASTGRFQPDACKKDNHARLGQRRGVPRTANRFTCGTCRQRSQSIQRVTHSRNGWALAPSFRSSSDARGESDRSDHDPTRRGTPVLGQADRAARDLRRPGRHRHREHAAVRGGAGEQARASGVARVPDGDRRGAGVISRSLDRLQPVFDAIAENAARLCKADSVRSYCFEEDDQAAASHVARRPWPDRQQADRTIRCRSTAALSSGRVAS